MPETDKQTEAEIRRCVAGDELLVPKLSQFLLDEIDRLRADIQARNVLPRHECHEAQRSHDLATRLAALEIRVRDDYLLRSDAGRTLAKLQDHYEAKSPGPPVHWQPTDGYPSARCQQAREEPTGVFTVTRERPLLTCPDCIALVDPWRDCKHLLTDSDGETWQCRRCRATGKIGVTDA